MTADASPRRLPPTAARGDGPRPPQLGLRENWLQFTLLALLTSLVGITIGVERVALPPLAGSVFGIHSLLYTVSFVTAFGAVKAVMNLVSGWLSDRAGRRGLLLVGWLFAIPYALLIIVANSWVEVVVANLFLGVNQALTWTMTVTSKIDLVGPGNRGLAVGVNEASGYVGVGLGGFVAGLLAASHGLRPAPYLFALAVVAVGLLLSLWPVRETLPWARAEATAADGGAAAARATPVPSLRRMLAYVSWHDRTLLAVSQAGLVNKVADSLVIGFAPLYLLGRGASLIAVGAIVGVYAWVWGLGQVGSGVIADRWGRKPPIVAGTFGVAGGILLVLLGDGLPWWFAGAAVAGAGTALLYPNLITAVSDVSHPAWRGSSLGVYRLWRDAGYAVGPLLLGGAAALGGVGGAFWAAAVLQSVSGMVLLVLMRETQAGRRHHRPAWQGRPEWLAAR